MKTGKLIREAIFSSGTEQYVSPMEPGINEQVVIRCRTGKDNADVVYLVIENGKIQMEKEKSGQLFDYYKTTVQLGTESFAYCFLVQRGRKRFTLRRKAMWISQSRGFIIAFFQATRRRTGQKVRYFIRSMWTGLTTETVPMMW